MNDFKPITAWTAAELIEAAHERGTGFDPIFDEMLRRLEEAERARLEVPSNVANTPGGLVGTI